MEWNRRVYEHFTLVVVEVGKAGREAKLVVGVTARLRFYMSNAEELI